MLTWLPLLVSCGLGPSGPGAPDSPPTRPTPRASVASAFAHLAADGTFEVPDSTRPDGAPAPDEFSPLGQFVHHESRNKTSVLRIGLPIHDNLMPTRTHGTHTFGREPPPGLSVTLSGNPLTFERGGRKPWTYGFDRDHLYLGLPPEEPVPSAAAVKLTFARATDTENDLNFATAGLEPAQFVVRTLTVGQTSHTGLLLPAPAAASWTVTVPEDARLTFEGTVLEPAIAHAQSSDGARATIVVTDGGVEHLLGHTQLSVGQWATGRFDLSRFSGRTVQVAFRTDPGETATFDYVFLEAPTLYSATDDPQRVVLVFVDTLRPDHLGMYGYERPTSPSLDAWAEHGTVFEQARSVAPWTLPSARAVLSGRQPELWYEGDTLPGLLSAAGWHTEAIVSNAFLSQPFDMHPGWDRYHYEHLGPAADLARYAQRVLGRHADRDTLVMVHLMEPHMPYSEPMWYRRTFASAPPDDLEALTRNWLVLQDATEPAFGDIRQYVIDRYDQNIMAADHALGALLRSAGSDATVVLFSDHGEEFWDHGNFEHGHDFHDELLHVPLVVRSPGIPSGRVEAPVSLLDVTPTVLELAGLHVPDDSAGRSLVGVAWGDDGAYNALAARPQGFGRPLYGDDGWGVVADGHKWWDRGGRQRLFSLDADPLETLDLAPGSPDLPRWPAALGEALDREVVLAWRVELSTTRWPFPTTVTVSHPDGIADAWSAYDPRGRTVGARPEVVDARMEMVIPPGGEAPEVLYVVPEGDAYAATGLTVSIDGRQVDVTATVTEHMPAPRPGAKHPPLLASGQQSRGWSFVVDLGWAPIPEGVAVAGFHADMADQLRELGYLDDE